MTAIQRALYARIQWFDFDDGPCVLSFAGRLSRENGWRTGFTARVIDEYRRFLFLLVEAGHPVTPSDQVDQAWHLHLLYTESYWTRLCDRTLSRPLHHHPTAGGRGEQDKFRRWYADTLASYRRFFQIEAPVDIWPSASIRFGIDTRYERVNTHRHWIIRKPWVRGESR